MPQLKVYENSYVKSLVALVVFALCALNVHAQVAVPGTCQQVTVEQNFDVAEYLGLWYENQRYFAFFELNAKCVTATYAANPNGTVEVLNYQVNAGTGVEDEILGWAELDDPASGEAKLTVHFPTIGEQVLGQYWVLDTDYTSYSVVWSCTQSAPETTLQNAWVLTREQVPSAETLAAAQAVIDANQLSPNFSITDQTGCP